MTLPAKVRRPVLAVTCGEPAGIGPEISLKAAWQVRAHTACVLIGDAAFLALTAAAIDPAIRLAAMSSAAWRNDGLPDFPADRIAVIDCPLAAHVVPGRLDPRNGRSVLQTLDLAIDGAQRGQFQAIVTAPLQKSTINEAGVPFTGHTELLAEMAGSRVAMMLATERLRVVHVSTHVSLRQACDRVRHDRVLETIGIAAEGCRRLGIARPRLAVAGLNPHAGEHGLFGDEDAEEIAPAIADARATGIDASGPWSPDTIFYEASEGKYDCVVAMYHDQGHIAIKMADFYGGVNITLGLPFVRTSVDHGTGFAIAGQGIANARSMRMAITLAAQMARGTE